MSKLPPTLAQSNGSDAELAQQRKLERERRDAEVRGVSSIAGMRDAVKAASAKLAPLDAIPRFGKLSAAEFRSRARQGNPFLMTGIVGRWPLTGQSPDILRERYADLHVRARVGDYIGTAFAPDRAMRDMTMGEYLDLVEAGGDGLPPYLGNLELKELNSLCHWPGYFDKMGPARFWIGPAGTVTPLHCDYDDNIFAQIWGTKRLFLAPPHHEAYLYPSEANALLFGSPVNPAAPDLDAFPLGNLQQGFTGQGFNSFAVEL